ncbi:unnamed protein product, partial [Phaeothamnion confervicola]
MEARRRWPHDALRVARAVSEASLTVLGPAGAVRTPAAALAAAAALPPAGTAIGGGSNCNGWGHDPLEALTAALEDLVDAWDAHGLCVGLHEWERLGAAGMALLPLRRVHDPALLPLEVSHHVRPLAHRHGLDADALLLDFVLASCSGWHTAARAAVGTTFRGRGGGGGMADGGAGGGGGRLLAERRAVAAVRCMSPAAASLRARAVLTLVHAASCPCSPELWSLAREAAGWGSSGGSGAYGGACGVGPAAEELAEAARALALADVVRRHRVDGFDPVDPAHASQLLEHVASRVGCAAALEDALQVAACYRHLDERRAYVEFLQNLAMTPPPPSLASVASATESIEEALVAAVAEAGTVTAGTGEPAVRGGAWEARLCRQAARVEGVLRSIADRRLLRDVAQEALLFCVRTLEDIEMDAVEEGLPPGRLMAAGATAAATTTNGGGNGDDAIVAEEEENQQDRTQEAQCAAVAASVLAAVLHETEWQAPSEEVAAPPFGAASAAAGWRVPRLHVDAAALVSDLRRLRSLQSEFGLFPSLMTLRGNPEACWRIAAGGSQALLKQGGGGGMGPNFHSRRKKCARAARSSGGAGDNGSGSSGSGSRGTADGDAQEEEVLHALLRRTRRPAELLGVPLDRVVAHAAAEAARQGRVGEVLALCRGLLDTRIPMERGTVAAALRDVALTLSGLVAAGTAAAAKERRRGGGGSGGIGGGSGGDGDGGPDETSVQQFLQATAASLRALRRSTLLCDGSGLPRVADFMQGTELVAAVLARSGGGEGLMPLVRGDSDGFGGRAAFGRRNGGGAAGDRGGRSGAHFGADSRAAAEAGGDGAENGQGGIFGGETLHSWARGGGLVLPLGEALAAVGKFAFLELQCRLANAAAAAEAAALGNGDGGGGGCGSRAHGSAGNENSGKSTALATAAATGMAAALADAADRLAEVLSAHGAHQLCLRALAGMAAPAPAAAAALEAALAAAAARVLAFRPLDDALGTGYLLALPIKAAFEVFRRAIPAASSDFGRLSALACVGVGAAGMWGHHELLAQCRDLERNAHWWRVLSALGVRFDHRGFRQDGASAGGGGGSGSGLTGGGSAAAAAGRGEYQKTLVGPLLEQSGGDLQLALEFCDHYHIPDAFPCLLYAERELSPPAAGAAATKTDERVMAVLPDIHGHQLVALLRHLLSPAARRVAGTDHERLVFLFELLATRLELDANENGGSSGSGSAGSGSSGASSGNSGDGSGLAGTAAECDRSLAVLRVLRSYRGVRTAPGAIANGDSSDDSGRLCFWAVRADPWAVLQPELNADTILKLIPLAGPLGVEPSEFYSRLVVQLFCGCGGGGIGGGAGAGDGGITIVMPPVAEVRHWLGEIRSLALACVTAQWTA